MDFITQIEEALITTLPKIIQQYQGEVAAADISSMEQAVRGMSQRVGKAVLQAWVEKQDEKYPSDERACPHCGGQAKYVRRRKGVMISMLGRLGYSRSYYSCLACQQGHYPVDVRLGIAPGQMSEEVLKCAALAGITASFEASQEYLARLSLLELSPNSIRKASQTLGERIIAQESNLLKESQSEEAQLAQRRDPEKPERLYGSMDGFMVLLEDGWHEMKAGAWWTTTPTHQGELRATDIRYYVDYLPASEFEALVWATGFQQKADQAHELVFIADGAPWIWQVVERHFPHAIQILDFYHASSYLAPIAKIAFANELQATAWLDQQTEALWQGHLTQVFRACRALACQAPDAVAAALTYFTRHRHRMRYAKFRQQGLQIGSGSMESGCKQIGLARLKIAGAQWSPDGARKLAKARAAYLSGNWDDLTPSSDALPQVA